MLDAPTALPPPAIVAPAPREVSFGLVAGSAPAGTRRVIVRVGEQVLADRPLRGTRFSLSVDLPPRIVWVRVTAVDAAGRRSSSLVGPVLGLSRRARPRAVAPRPSVLLMDEPFSGLDRSLRDDVREDTLAVLRPASP